VLAEQHVGCASNGDEHHPGDTYRLTVNSALEPSAGAKKTCRYEPQKDIEDLGRHPWSPLILVVRVNRRRQHEHSAKTTTSSATVEASSPGRRDCRM
jgi:hypothetical protein